MVNLGKWQTQPTPQKSPKEEVIFAYGNKKDFYIDRTRRTIIKVLSAVLIFTIIFSVVRNFVYIDAPNGCFIKIDPGVTEFNNSSLVEGLDLIKRISPEDYSKVCKNVRHMSPNVGCGGIHGGCYYENQPKKIYVNNSNRNVLTAAAIIVHETCHSIQSFDHRQFDENECYREDDEIIKMIVQY